MPTRSHGRSFLFLMFLFALAIIARPVSAQSDVIRGHVLNTEGLPLPNVRITATSIPGGVTRETRTDARGAFQIVFPGGPGDYIMGYALIGYVFRQFEVKRLADEDVLLADTRLSVIQLDTVRVVDAQQQKVNRNSSTPDVGGTERQIPNGILPPEAQGDIAAMAASLPGVLLVPGLDGAADGFSVLGLGADQNSVTLNGMQLGANGLPRDAAISASLTTSPYDASRGGFSGGNFNIRTASGSNYVGRGMSLLLNTPQLEWTDPAARALGNEYTNVSLGGVASGPFSRDKSFYNISWQLGRQSRDNQTLLGTNELGLATAGISNDSVTRFVGILDTRGVPLSAGPLRSQRVSDNGTALSSFDWAPPNSTSGQSFNVTVNGNWARQSPVGGGATQLASSGGDRINWGGGIQGKHSGYFGLTLTETSAGINVTENHGSPYLSLPSGRVRVTSILPDGGSGVQSLVFGGNQGLSSSARSANASVQNTLSWFDDQNKHRIKLTSELQYGANQQNQASNLLGTYYYNSLEDLEAGRPASFTRMLTARRRSTGQLTGSIALGDSYRRTQDLQIQYGVRVDATHFTARPAFNAAVDSIFHLRNDRVPTPLAFSPRIGFSYTLGQSQEVQAFFGEARRPRAVVRGGVGVFTNASSSGLIGAALDNTGLPSGAQQIECVGEAVPSADWNAFATDPSSIPDRCADGTAGGTVFSSASPNVTLFSRHFAPQQSVRSNLAWSGAVLDARFTLDLEGNYSLNLHQQRQFDVNFDPRARFTLDDGRPVYVEPTSIVPTTGTLASRDARVSQAFARVNEVRSDLQSRTAQLTMRLSPINRSPSSFSWSAAYTYSRIDEQVSGFNNTAGNPALVEWSRSGQGPHQITYNLRYTFFRSVTVNWNGSFRSGTSFTPMIAGDVNGDGYGNDRAFIPPPSAAGDSALAAGMQQLLGNATGRTRDCLTKQLGRIADRNSCVGPWTSNASVNVTLDRAKFRMPQRAAISFSLSNPLGAADLLVNGSGHLRGWGQSASPDQSLLYVRGFDPSTNRYQYEVNQRFGATRPQFLTLRSPVVLTASIRYDLGPTRERQSLVQMVRAGRSQPGSRAPDVAFRSFGVNGIPNPMTTILRQQDSLRLTSLQADSIAVMNRRYTYRTDSLWAPVGRSLAALPTTFDEHVAYDRWLAARHAQVDMLMQMAPAIDALLTKEQKRKLPASTLSMLDRRYLASIRDGNALYANGSGALRGGGF